MQTKILKPKIQRLKVLCNKFLNGEIQVKDIEDVFNNTCHDILRLVLPKDKLKIQQYFTVETFASADVNSFNDCEEYFVADLDDIIVDVEIPISVERNLKILSSWISPDGEFWPIKDLCHTDFQEEMGIDETKWLKYSMQHGFAQFYKGSLFRPTSAQIKTVKKYYGEVEWIKDFQFK